MQNVVDFSQKKLEKSPHISGPVVCSGCKHEWVGVAPRNCKTELECPKCSAMRGVWKHHFRLEEATLSCPACEGHLFEVTSWGINCIGCGERATFKTIFGE